MLTVAGLVPPQSFHRLRPNVALQVREAIQAIDTSTAQILAEIQAAQEELTTMTQLLHSARAQRLARQLSSHRLDQEHDADGDIYGSDTSSETAPAALHTRDISSVRVSLDYRRSQDSDSHSDSQKTS